MRKTLRCHVLGVETVFWWYWTQDRTDALQNTVKYVNLSMKGAFMVCCIKWALYDYTANKNAAIIVL